MAKIPVDKIFISKYNIRKSEPTKDLEELAKSIRDIGLINPILVIERNGKYELIAGQRRFRAVRDILKEEEIEAKILPPTIDETTALIYSLSENLQKREPKRADYVRAAEILYEKYGEDVEKVAEVLHIPVKKAMDLLKKHIVPIEVAKLVDKGKLSWTKAMQLAEAAWPDKEKIIELANELINMPTTRAKKVIRAATINPKASTKEIITLADSLPDTIRLRNVEISKEVYDAIKKYAKQTNTDISYIVEEALKAWLEYRG